MKLFRMKPPGDEADAPHNHIGALGDFWRYMQEDRPHKWASMGLAITIPAVVLYFIWRSLLPAPAEPTIIYVESWPADRSQADVEREWKQRAIEANARNAQRRAQFQRAADALGIDYREDADGKAEAPAKAAPQPAQPAKP